MISADMRVCNYYTSNSIELGSTPIGQVKIAIKVSDVDPEKVNSLFSGCQYLGLTQDDIGANYLIATPKDSKLLKVLYVLPEGRYRQVYLTRTTYNSNSYLAPGEGDDLLGDL